MKVAEVMTSEVLSVPPTALLKDVAEALIGRGISGVPVIGPDREVLGVVSECDVLVKERGPEEPRRRLLARLLAEDDPAADLKLEARTAGEAMTAPAVTVPAGRSVQEAATIMLEHGIKRLPVVDERGRLIGIVTRADLVRAFVRPDAEIEREIREDVLLRELWLEPDSFDVRVVRGEVRIEGAVGSADDRDLLERRVASVPGVVAVDTHVAVAA